MSIFSRNTKLNSEEYEKLIKRFAELESTLTKIQGELEALKTNQNSLRGLVNRKIGGIKEEEETQGINNPVILPYNGAFK